MSDPTIVTKYGRWDQVLRDSGGNEYALWDIRKGLKTFDQPLVLDFGKRYSGKTYIAYAIINALAPVTKTVWICDPAAQASDEWSGQRFTKSLHEQGITHKLDNHEEPDVSAILAYQAQMIRNCGSNSLMLCIIDNYFPTNRVWSQDLLQFLCTAGQSNIYVVITSQYFNNLPPQIIDCARVVVHGHEAMRTICTKVIHKWLPRWTSRTGDTEQQQRDRFKELTSDWKRVVAIEGDILWFRAHSDEPRRTGDACKHESQINAMTRILASSHFEPLYRQACQSVCISDLVPLLLSYIDITTPIQAALDKVINRSTDPDLLQLAAEAEAIAGHDAMWTHVIPSPTVLVDGDDLTDSAA